MKYTLEELRQKVFESVFGVYDIFKNHFGEQFVDLQNVPTINEFETLVSLHDDYYTKENEVYTVDSNGINGLKTSCNFRRFSIYVWFPQVTITNENDKSISIQDLYVLVEIDINGKIPLENWGMLWNRSRYSRTQWDSNYMHSHIREIPKDELTKFMKPCLGASTIAKTIHTLKLSCSDEFWMLFCHEISQAVTIESLEGRPWNNLESVGRFTESCNYICFEAPAEDIYQNMKYTRANYRNDVYNSPYWLHREEFMSMLRDFTSFYLNYGHFSFCFDKGKFDVGMSHFDFMVDISNAFITYYNYNLKADSKKKQFLYKTGFLNTVYVKDMEFMALSNSTNMGSVSQYVGKHVLYFKGKDITLQIDEDDNNTLVETTLLNHKVAMYILGQILKIVNYRFENGKYKEDGSRKEVTSTRQTVYYL